MYKATLATYPNTSTEISYGQNLAHAARAFVAALLAVQPAPAKPAQAAQVTPSARAKAVNVRKLYKLAADYDSISPSLAAELRNVAGRD